MPKYSVIAPDGRKVTLEGDTQPTDADFDEAIASLPRKTPDIGGEQAMLHPDTSRSEPGAGHPYAQLGRGIEDASAKMLLGARQIFGMEQPDEASAIRAQLKPQSTLETVGQTAPGAALAAAIPGAQGLAGVGLDAAVGGGLSALESGNPADAATGALMSGGLSAATRGFARMLPRSADKNIDRIAMDPGARDTLAKSLLDKFKGLGVAAGTVVGGKAAGAMGMGVGSAVGGAAGAAMGDPVSRLLSSGKFNSLSARAKLKVYDALRSGGEDALRTLWRLLPEERQQSLGPSTPTTADMLAEAKRRKAANAVLR